MNAAELEAHAAFVLMGRCRVEEPTAVRALEDAAIEFGVPLADLAALVVAASLVPPGWASSRGALVETTAPRLGEDRPASPGEDDPHDPASVPSVGRDARTTARWHRGG